MSHSGTTPGHDERASSATAVRVVRCPTCRGESVYAPTNPYRPFCSAVCKGIDLGAWASEQYRVPEQGRAVSPDDEAPPGLGQPDD